MSRAATDAPRHLASARRKMRWWTGAVTAVVSLMAVAAGSAQAQADTEQTAVPGSAWTTSEQLLSADLADASRAGYRVWASPGATLAPADGQLRVAGLGPGASFSVVAPAVGRDALVSTTFTASPSGGSYYAGASVRLQSNGSRYAATATVRPGGAVVVTTQRVDADGTSVLDRATTPTSAGAAVRAPLRLELQATGANPSTVRARVWPEGTPTPDWQVTGTDSGPGEITQQGRVALAGYLSRSASSAEVSLGGLSAWSLVPAAPSSGEPSAPSPGEPSSDPTSALTAGPTTEPTRAPAASSTGIPTPATSTSSPAGDPTTAAPSSSAPTATPAASSASSSPVPSGVSSGHGSAPGVFAHPGIVVSGERLVFVRAQIAAGREPWTSALASTRSAWYAKASWTPKPVAQVQCGAYNNPDIGCTAETDDAQAAYTNALLYSLTGEQRYADKAIEVLDAWSGVLRGHSFDTTLYKNGRLQSAWAGQTFTKAAELIRHSRAGWAPDRVARFEGMLRTAFLPMVRDGWTGGQANWQMSMAEATMNIGVFLDDRAVFEDGLGDWRAQVVSAFYLTSDGPQPIPPLGTSVKASYVPTFFYNPSAFVDGLGQETCRDLGHTSMGLAAALNAAETAKIQGIDLYGEQRTRLVAAMELTTRYLRDPSAPGWVCPQPPKMGGTAGALTYQIGLHHYEDEEGLSLPSTEAWVQQNRPSRSGIFMNWETLTHG